MKYWEESPDTVILKFYGIITSWWNGASDFTSTMEELERKYKRCKIRMHCYGGEVIEGNVIFNAIKRSKMEIEIYIDGISASMATIVMLAAKKIYMAENAFVMIHRPIGYTSGGAKAHFANANLLKQMEKNFSREYARKTGKSETAIEEWFDGEDHWFGADDAKKIGIVDEIIAPVVTLAEVAKPDNKENEQSVFNRFAAALTNPSSQPTHSNTQHSPTMKKELIDKLGLKGVTADSSDTAVIDAVASQISGLQTQLNTLQGTQVTTLIAAAETKAGRQFTAEQKKQFQEIGSKAGLESLQMVLAFAIPGGETTTHESGTGGGQQQQQQPAQVPLTSMIGGKQVQGAEDRSKWTFTNWADQDEKGLDEMRTKDAAKYKQLYKAEYGSEPEL